MSIATLHVHFVNSLQKLLQEQPLPAAVSQLTTLKGETVSVQAAIQVPSDAPRCRVSLVVDSPVSAYIRLRKVIDVPVRLPVPAGTDDYVLSTKSGLYPDLLAPYEGEPVWLQNNSINSFWLDITVPETEAAGTYPVTVHIIERKEDSTAEPTGEERSITLSLTVKEQSLPVQQLICTHWMHTDCLSQYYRVSVFSEEYWRITEQYMREAAATGINMILTPLFTPPLDTAIGGERLTVQLIDVTITENGGYTFGFDRLKRWVDTACRAGMSYFEMSHLFTQWGAKACPKVMADTPTGERRIFGWDTPSDGTYLDFLAAFLPCLTARLQEWGIADRCYFHLSDEPSAEALPHYLKLKETVAPFLEGFTIMDALSHYDFYEQGAVSRPVVAINAVEPFLEHRVTPLWVYYCCGMGKGMSNRFIALPSARNRVLGFQMYLADVKGFLHWGFNFYNAAYSLHPINPYLSTDADGAFPAGDPFLVYPGEDGRPYGSIRQMVFAEALQDLRACQQLEKTVGRDEVYRLIREGGVHGFFDYTHSADELLALRDTINRLL